MPQFVQHPFNRTAAFGKLLALLLLCSLATACTQAAPALPPTPPSTDTIAPTQTASPIPATETLTATPLPTATPTDTQTPTPIPTPTITPTLPPLPITQIDRVCLAPETTLPPDFLTEGTIFLSKYGDGENPDRPLFTVSSQQLAFTKAENIPYIYGRPFHTSPDGKYALYSTRKTANAQPTGLLILGDNSIVNETKDECKLGWVSGEYVLCQGLSSSDVIPAGYTEFTFELLNPFTSETQDVSVKLPRVYIEPDERMYLYPFLDPGLTKVVYLEGVWGGTLSLVLWDISAEKVIWKLERLPVFSSFSIWSPSGEFFALATVDDKVYTQYIVGLDGNAQQWINLDYGKMGYTFFGIGGRETIWSPNGRYLAMQAHAEREAANVSESGYSLLILDTWTRQLTDFCNLDPVTTFFWSPDSTQLVTEYASKEPMVVDIVQQKAARLNMVPLDYGVVGWVAERAAPTPVPH